MADVYAKSFNFGGSDRYFPLPISKGAGIEWSMNNVNASFNKICYSNNLWVGGSGNNTGIWYSTDCITWTQSNITSGSMYDVCYANEMWVATKGLTFYKSTDGKFWEEQSIEKIIRYICYENGLWVAGCQDTGFCYSTDFSTWTDSNITNVSAEKIYYINNIWLGTTSGNGLYYSEDGMNWTQSNLTSGYVGDICYSEGLFVLGFSMSKYGLYYSTDGKNWNSNYGPGNLVSIYHANNLWVAGGTMGILYSTDGINWSKTNIETSIKMKRVSYFNGIWVAGGDNGLYYSTDGMTWTQSNITSTTTLGILFYDNGMFLAFDDGHVYYSIGDVGKILMVGNDGNAAWTTIINAEEVAY